MSNELKQTENLPAELMEDFEADAGAGMENADRDSFSVPFLRVIQSNSPEIEEVDGAKPGKIVNTATQEIFDSVQVIPVSYERTYIEWVPRDNGGGMAGHHTVEEGKRLEAKHGRDGAKIKLDNGNDLIDTRQHYVLLVHEDGTTEPAMIAMSSTHINNSKDWMNKISRRKTPNGNTAPMYSTIYELGTRKRQKDTYSWHVWTVDVYGWVDGNQYSAAKAFYDSIQEGAVEADLSEANTEEEQF